jgi:hypothetical protein
MMYVHESRRNTSTRDPFRQRRSYWATLYLFRDWAPGGSRTRLRSLRCILGIFARSVVSLYSSCSEMPPSWIRSDMHRPCKYQLNGIAGQLSSTQQRWRLQACEWDLEKSDVAWINSAPIRGTAKQPRYTLVTNRFVHCLSRVFD